ncbi:MAG: hypothetical protein JJU27_06480 [Gammaproteobacteria bacterium]|nr:hypothetical protein [Gammaproteobacteria bacterium]
MTTYGNFETPEPRPSHIRSPLRIFFLVMVSFVLIPMALMLTLGGVTSLLLGEGAEAMRYLVPATLVIGGLVLLTRWAVRRLPVNADGSVGGRVLRVNYPDLARQEEFRMPEPGAGKPRTAPGRRPAIRWQPGGAIAPDREAWTAGSCLAVAIVWLVAGGGIVSLATMMAASSSMSLDLGFFVAAGGLVLVPSIGMFVMSLVLRHRTRDWQACRVELPDGPGRPGESFRLRAILPHPPDRTRRVEAALVHRTRLPGTRRDTPVRHAENWRQEIVAHARADAAGSIAELHFELPEDAPASSQTLGPNASLWQLELKAGGMTAQAPGLRGEARFTVPVVARQSD